MKLIGSWRLEKREYQDGKENEKTLILKLKNQNIRVVLHSTQELPMAEYWNVTSANEQLRLQFYLIILLSHESQCACADTHTECCIIQHYGFLCFGVWLSRVNLISLSCTFPSTVPSLVPLKKLWVPLLSMCLFKGKTL